MSKEIVLFLPSRNNPEGCMNTLTMLFETCQSPDNFDVMCAVDEDQIEMYSEVINKFQNIAWVHPQHTEQSFVQLNKIHFELVEKTTYYFNWWIVDDFWGLSKDWDAEIIKKKDLFSDGFYTLYTFDPMGRNLNALSSCFKSALHWQDGHRKPPVTDPALLIYHYHEMLPVCTRNWKLAIKKFYYNHDGGDHVFLNASLAYILNKEHGYSRMIPANFNYKGIVDNHNASTVQHAGLFRDDHFYNSAVLENFRTAKIVAYEVFLEIWHHNRDLMDKPRKIGKYAEE